MSRKMGAQPPAKVAFRQGRRLTSIRFTNVPKVGQSIQTMKKLLCILASAALLGACEQKTDVVAPASPAPDKKTENKTTIVNPASTVKETKETTNTNTNTTTTATTPPNSSSSTTTTTTTSPSP